MALSVKSYLNYEGSEPEIRRFSMPQDVSASYEYLVEKIRRVYPSLLRKDFQLYWRGKKKIKLFYLNQGCECRIQEQS